MIVGVAIGHGVAPIGSLSIALVMSAQTLYLSRYVHLFVTAVIGGSIVLEVLVQRLSRRQPEDVAEVRA